MKTPISIVIAGLVIAAAIYFRPSLTPQTQDRLLLGPVPKLDFVSKVVNEAVSQKYPDGVILLGQDSAKDFRIESVGYNDDRTKIKVRFSWRIGEGKRHKQEEFLYRDEFNDWIGFVAGAEVLIDH